jgi:hypothetical protein
MVLPQLHLRGVAQVPGAVRVSRLRAGYEVFPEVRGNEENKVRQEEVDDSLPFAEVSTSRTNMAAITCLCNAQF